MLFVFILAKFLDLQQNRSFHDFLKFLFTSLNKSLKTKW